MSPVLTGVPGTCKLCFLSFETQAQYSHHTHYHIVVPVLTQANYLHKISVVTQAKYLHQMSVVTQDKYVFTSAVGCIS